MTSQVSHFIHALAISQYLSENFDTCFETEATKLCSLVLHVWMLPRGVFFFLAGAILIGAN